ncbi:Peptide-methionine (R)-S-oxide reductase MsrB [hydrothermal vent metagenome]|uniref:peptide-methionine (R)-S-oxide reductase n=1 Tax=hydrothermal vent metagenome TaxID=652676 RepID=A0A3B0TRK5_9ZZZZ
MLQWKDVINFSVKGNLQPDRRVDKTELEWQELLTPEQFRVTRKKGTEAAHTGALCSSHEAGKYNCACCNSPLFDSTIKFESGTGWPSFTQPIQENAIKYEKDTAFGMVRVEVMCNTCDAHLGHVFPDGPKPSGLRYCINSESMRIEPAPAGKKESVNNGS